MEKQMLWKHQIRSDQISRSVVSDSLRLRESQHARPPCPSPTPGVHSDWRPSSQWCHPAISSSVIPFSSCPQSLPASESFPMSQLFAWGGQSTRLHRHVNICFICFFFISQDIMAGSGPVFLNHLCHWLPFCQSSSLTSGLQHWTWIKLV